MIVQKFIKYEFNVSRPVNTYYESGRLFAKPALGSLEGHAAFKFDSCVFRSDLKQCGDSWKIGKCLEMGLR